MGNIVLIIAGIIFALVGILHLLRAIFRVKITIGSFVVPVWFSLIGFIIPLLLALGIFKSLK